MTDSNEQPLSAAALIELTGEYTAGAPCRACQALACPGWEAVPGSVDRDILERIGSLRDPAIEDPTVAEYHPAGANAWSPDAPVAPAWFPYNRCDAWRCTTCRRPFLRYTEYGGYYTEERIRELEARLVVDVPPP